MSDVLFFMMESCPHCKKAKEYINSLTRNNGTYAAVKIEMIDEVRHPEIAEKYDYYYVPTFFINGVKVHEGTVNLEQIKAVLDKAVAE